MPLILSLLIQATAATGPASGPPPRCESGAAARELLEPAHGVPKPLGLVVGAGSDWGSRYLVVATTHHLAVPGIPSARGRETATVFVAVGDSACALELTEARCPALRPALHALASNTYPVLHRREGLREGHAFHPPFGFIHARDGDGNTVKVSGEWTGHPVMDDVHAFFHSIAHCTSDAERALRSP